MSASLNDTLIRCPISALKIFKVFDAENDRDVQEKGYNELFKIHDNGIFELLKFDKVYKNY